MMNVQGQFNRDSNGMTSYVSWCVCNLNLIKNYLCYTSGPHFWRRRVIVRSMVMMEPLLGWWERSGMRYWTGRGTSWISINKSWVICNIRSYVCIKSSLSVMFKEAKCFKDKSILIKKLLNYLDWRGERGGVWSTEPSVKSTEECRKFSVLDKGGAEFKLMTLEARAGPCPLELWCAQSFL